MKPPPIPNLSESVVYVFMDLECRQDENYSEGNDTMKRHVPNLCVAQTSCSLYIGDGDEVELLPCVKCGVREYVFEGEGCIKDLFTLLTDTLTDLSEVIVLAHNMKGYDGVFLLDFCTRELQWDAKIILSGTKIHCVTYKKFRILDSIIFLPMALRLTTSAVFGRQ